MNFKDIMKALNAIEEDRHISKDIIVEALKDALEKAYRKHLEIPDALVRVDINEVSGVIRVFKQRTIVEESEDDELEISLADAQKIRSEYQLGEIVEEEVPIIDFGRAAAVLAKNVMRQKIREAEKAIVYDEYVDKLEEMVQGIVESVEEKYVIVNLGRTLAMMPKGAQIPGERYKEGQRIYVVIAEVNKETKGAQVLVTRSDANLVKRLFEREVPEIYDGTVEIKAIAREAGERTKMAVRSHNPDVDAIGACIGQRGSRVQVVMDELKGEKIDIFEWSDDVIQLIKNSLSPAIVLGVIEGVDRKGLTVVVPDNQLSLAIGKKGKNARLAVRLTNLKIDIKSESDMSNKGIDYRALSIKSRMPEVVAEEETVAEVILPAVEEVVEVAPVVKEVVVSEAEELPEAEAVQETPIAVTEAPKEKPVAISKKEPKPAAKEKTEAIPVKERGVRKDYVSRFEKFADKTTGATVEDPRQKRDFRKKPATDAEERRVRLNIRDLQYEVKPEYSEEELEEIKLNEMKEHESTWYNSDIDYDEYDEYYDEDDK